MLRPLRLPSAPAPAARWWATVGLFGALATTAVGTGCVTPAGRLDTAPRFEATSKSPSPAAIEERFVAVDVGDAFLRARVTGPADSRKTPVVLVHGFGARLENWRAVQDALSVDRVVVAFDQKGFGESERPDGDYGPEKHGQDVLKVMDALGLERAVLAGHSYGGGVVMRAAVLGPRRVAGVVLVDALILEEQVPTSFKWAKAPLLGEAIFSVLFKELPGEKYVLAFHDGQRFANAKVLDEVHALQHREGSTYAQLATVRAMGYADAQAKYRKVLGDKPRAVIWGDDDRVLPLSQGRAVAAAVDANLTVAAACGHVPIIERPHLVTEVLRGVLEKADVAPLPVEVEDDAPASTVMPAETATETATDSPAEAEARTGGPPWPPSRDAPKDGAP